jgi:LysR family transcriptional regulator, glycine cleavage system transcriptional activator
MFDTLPLNALRSFEVVARTGSFTLAAAELHVTQSAVSHQIKLLEKWVGKPLFERQGKHVKLFAHAATLAKSLNATFAELDMACRQVRTVPSSNTLVIAVIPSVATCWLIPRLSDFRTQFPAVTTRVIYAIHGHPVDFNDVDVAIIYSRDRPAWRQTTAERLLPGDSAPVCSVPFLELQGDISSPQQMLKAGLLHDTDRRGWSQWFQKATPNTVEFGDGPIFEDFNLLRAATLAGQGISLCPLSIIEDDLRSNRLIALSTITVNAESAYYVVQATTGVSQRRHDVECFRSWLFKASLADQDC